MTAIDWSDGEYERIARSLVPAAEMLLDALGVAAGDRVLDVGCGSGNLALAAAARGAQVTAVDPAAGLVERARAQPGADEVTWGVMEGGELPVPAGAFDVVASCFAVIFAPDPEQAAAGLRRAAAPGGRIGMTAWVPEGAIADVGRLLMGGLAPGRTPPAWSDPAVAAELLGADVELTRHGLPFTASSPEAWFDEQERHHPAWRMGGRELGDAWPELRARSIAVLAEANEDPAAFRTTSPYVVLRVTA